MRALTALLIGALFGSGLLVSGMTDTAKVQGWLDLFGAWDPALAFVLGGAIVPMVFAWRIAARREQAVLGGTFDTPKSRVIDAKLLTGSAAFGFGWALVGLCPGPALAVLSFGGGDAGLFVAAMVIGMLAHNALPVRQKSVAAE